MEAKQKIDTKSLDQSISSLQKSLAFVGDGSGTDSPLFKIIHRPGWTTIAQVAIAGHILDAMNQQAAALKGLRDALQKHVDSSVG